MVDVNSEGQVKVRIVTLESGTVFDVAKFQLLDLIGYK